MRIVLLRVGIDTGYGGIHGALFQDGTFEYIPIPDHASLDHRTYGNVIGTHGRPLAAYFPPSRQAQAQNLPIHVDPEFTTFTYGDPTPPKAGLRRLETGDFLLFYCGLEGWDFDCPPALYLIGYFEVQQAGLATDFSVSELQSLFGENFHVRHPSVFDDQRQRLVLVKGMANSRLLDHAIRISAVGSDRRGRPLKVLSPEMQHVFGDFGGRISIQRSPPRWVRPEWIAPAEAFIRSFAGCRR